MQLMRRIRRMRPEVVPGTPERGAASLARLEPSRRTDRAQLSVRRRATSWPPARTYLGLGAILGLGAPVGYLALRRFLGDGRSRASRPGVFSAEERIALAYIGLATPIAFGVFGRALGRREERLEASAEYVE